MNEIVPVAACTVASAIASRIAFASSPPAAESAAADVVAEDAAIEAAGVLGRTIVVPHTGWDGGYWGVTHIQLDLSRATRAGGYTGIELEIVAENI